MSSSNDNMAGNKQTIPGGFRTGIGIVVFSALLVAIVFGSGILDPKSNAANANTPIEQLPVKQRAELAMSRNQWKIAEEAYREMLKADQFDCFSMFYIGFSLHNQGKLDEAKEYYLKAADFHRFRIFSYYNLATIYSKQERLDESLEHLEQAIEFGMATREGIKTSKDFANLYDDPEFERLAILESNNRERSRRRSRNR